MKTIILLLLVYCAYAQQFVRVFSDSFSDLSNWELETINGQQTGNNEWQHYTDRPSNVFIGDSRFGKALHIVAKEEQYNGYKYTSGRLHSKNPQGPYGFYNIKALVPKGNGVWPAIWLLPPGARTKYGGWASCGEIDIMETVCANNEAYSTLHFGGQWPKNSNYPNNGNNKYPFYVDWNVPHWFGVNWQPESITFYMDAIMDGGRIKGGQLISSITPDKYWSEDTNGKRYPGNAPFDQPFNFILNVAIGGSWPCSVPGCCQNVPNFAEMLVFNVEVWQKIQGGDPVAPPPPPPPPEPAARKYCSKGEKQLSANEGQGIPYPNNAQGFDPAYGGYGRDVSVEHCQKICDRTDGCDAISYSSKSRMCFLKKGSSCNTNIDGRGDPFQTYWLNGACGCNADAPPSSSGNGYCTKGNAQLATNEGAGIAFAGSNDLGRNTGNLDNCLRACDSANGCNSVSFSSKSNMCWLKRDSSCTTNTDNRPEQYQTYWKNGVCQSCGGQPAGYCSKGEGQIATNEGAGVNFPGTGNHGEWVDTLEKCLQACERAPGCNAATYSRQSKMCFLKKDSSCTTNFDGRPEKYTTYWKTGFCNNGCSYVPFNMLETSSKGYHSAMTIAPILSAGVLVFVVGIVVMVVVRNRRQKAPESLELDLIQ